MKRAINPPELAEPVGFAHGWLVEHAGAKTLYLAGQCGYDARGEIERVGDLAGQMERAMRNIGCVLGAVGLGYSDLVQLNFYVRSRDDYALARREFGKVWQQLCARHYPAMAMFMVAGLFDPEALIEIQGIAAQ